MKNLPKIFLKRSYYFNVRSFWNEFFFFVSASYMLRPYSLMWWFQDIEPLGVISNRSSGWRWGALMNGISAHVRVIRHLLLLLCFQPWEDTKRRGQTASHTRTLPRTRVCWYPDFVYNAGRFWYLAMTARTKTVILAKSLGILFSSLWSKLK